MIIEVPCGNIESVFTAEKGGADRIELCSALPLGGLTPPISMLVEIAASSIVKVVMIRPREGDFIFSSGEFRAMLHDIELLRKAGAQGIVSGVLLRNGEIDVERTKTLIEATHPLPFTFHRAFDLTPDPLRSLEILIDMKVDRLLTSGHAADAFTGRGLISKLVRLAENKITIIAGAGVTSENVNAIVDETGIKEIHLSARKRKKSEMLLHNKSVQMGNIGDENGYDVCDGGVIRMVRNMIDKV